MDKELALRTFGYLIGYYRTHDEAIINTQEIEAIEFMLKINEELEQQCKKQKEVIDKAIVYYETYKQECVIGRTGEGKLRKDYYLPAHLSKTLIDILKEVSE